MSSLSNGNVIQKTVNCAEFSQSQAPNLKEMDHYMFVEYNGQGHLHPQRVSSARSKNVSSVKLTYYSADHICYLRNSADTLNFLDLSSSHLFKIPSDLISGMIQLQVINLNNNQLTDNSFCKEFSVVLGKSLKEISICNNNLTSLMSSLENFVKLVRLKISNNAISNLKGIEKLKRLKLLMAENNDISQLGSGFYLSKRLENVYLSHNKLTAVTIAIKNLVHLRELDLSFNNIKTIPGELFLISTLDFLKLNNNKIAQIQKFKITPRLNNPIRFVDISCNNVVRFPDCLMRITADLDLSFNKIKTVPSSVLKKIPYQSNQKVNLSNNPIIDPPKDICESGLKAMIQYYEEYEGTETKYYGIKIFCFGGESNKKNRVVNLLADQSEDDESRIDVIDILEIYDTNSKNFSAKRNDEVSYNVKVLNMSSESYHFKLLIFLQTNPALNLIFVDIDKWSNNRFEESVGVWLRNLLWKRNDLTFSVICVTTQPIDDVIQERCDFIQGKVTELFTKYAEDISNEINKIESKEKITASMSQCLKKFIQLKSVKVSTDNNVISVNIKDSKSFKILTNILQGLISEKTIFPNVGTPVPRFWSDVQAYIEDECYQFPIMSFGEFETLLQQKFNLKPVVRQVARYLHEIGCVLWWEDSTGSLGQWVITAPQILIDCCRLFLQPDFKAYLDDPNDSNTNLKRFKKNYPSSRLGYRRSCEILHTEGILLPELAMILLEPLMPALYVTKMLFYLCQCWNLGYIVEYAGAYCQEWEINNGDVRDNVSDVTRSSVASPECGRKSVELRPPSTTRRSLDLRNVRIPPLFLTLLCRRSQCLQEPLNHWQRGYNLRITICYRFPMGYPELIFHQAAVRAKDQTYVTFMDHWTNGFQGQIRDESILFRVQDSLQNNKDKVLQYDFIYQDDEVKSGSEINDCMRASEIWKCAQGILTDMDALLNSYQGLWFERLVKCPHCEVLSFPGTWHSYNDNDSVLEVLCTDCHETVPLYMLEPPRISKNVSAEEIIRNIRKQFER